MLLHGIFPPITTPFYPDSKVYYKKLEHNVARYSRTPIAGLTVLGSTGETLLLKEAERSEVLRCAAAAAAPDKVLIAGTGMESAVETLRLTEYAAELGYDVALVRTPYYYRNQINRPENMLAFYRFVADRSPLPVMIYNFPQATGYDITAELVIELAEHPNLIGIKESSGTIEKVRRMVEGTCHIKRKVPVTEVFQAMTPRMRPSSPLVGVSPAPGSISPVGVLNEGAKVREKEVGFQVLVGVAQKLLDSLQAGAVGAILAFADPAPTAHYEIYAAWKDNDLKLAGEKQQRIAAASARIAGEMSIPGLKYACDLNGYYGGPVRLPLLPLTADLRAEVERLMADIRS
jgi:dihydrodipicolinate synthase/N-acetylneuraminate lyase